MLPCHHHHHASTTRLNSLYSVHKPTSRVLENFKQTQSSLDKIIRRPQIVRCLCVRAGNRQVEWAHITIHQWTRAQHTHTACASMGLKTNSPLARLSLIMFLSAKRRHITMSHLRAAWVRILVVVVVVVLVVWRKFSQLESRLKTLGQRSMLYASLLAHNWVWCQQLS